MDSFSVREINTGRVDIAYVVREVSEGVYRYTRPGNQYTVDVEKKSCTCPSRVRPCKHYNDALLHHIEQIQGFKFTDKWMEDEDG